MKNNSGLLVLCTKLGIKILAVLTKSLKAVKIAKVSLAAASFAGYAVLFSWRFAVLILGMLFVHESGHIWAMKRYGMRTKGIYFIPFFGGAAVTEDAFPSRESEAVVALAGPLWGLGLTMAAAALYFFYRTPLLAAVSGWMAALNLFNLLPINPLDGGRVVKSIAYSVHTAAGHAIVISSMVAVGILMWILQMPFFTLLIVFGIVEFLTKSPRKKDLTPAQMGLLGIAYLGLICVLWMVMYAMRAVPGAELAMTLFKMD